MTGQDLGQIADFMTQQTFTTIFICLHEMKLNANGHDCS